MVDKEEVIEAARLLGIPMRASLNDIKTRYRKLVHEKHPDKNGSDSEDEFAKITQAYRVLEKYCSTYEISFDEKDIQGSEHDFWVKHFGNNM